MGGQLLTLAACAKLPVLALFESETEARQALQQVDGITDYLIKPVRYEDVQHLMSEWLLQGPEGKSAGL